MSINERKKHADITLKKLLIRLFCGAEQIYRMRYGRIFYLFATLIIVFSWNVRENIYTDFSNITLINLHIGATYIVTTVVVLFLFSKPILEYLFSRSFYKAGIVNHVEDTPILYDVLVEDERSRVKRYVFLSQGISLTKWRDKICELENSLNLSIQNIELGDNKQFIELIAVSGNYKFPDVLNWDDANIHEEENMILLGESYGKKLYADINLSPSFLIGGSTGSGKTILLKSILYQFLKRGNCVYIADFKGGVDYKRFWHENASLIYDKDMLIETLEAIIKTLEERKEEYRKRGYSNLCEYNKSEYEQDKRIIFACDEVAELLDKNGLEKEEKEKVVKIERLIGTIARQGRAFGIHLVLATQRPDANILTGQIKNNIEHKMCGRCENVLSQIVLDTTAAADLVPKNSKGMFLNQEEVLFKGYFLDL